MAETTPVLCRLRKRREFLVVAGSGVKAVSSTLVLQALPKPNAPYDPIRVGFTVSKKVSKKAVERNRVRRRLRAAVEQVMPEKGEPGWEYVVIGRLAALDAPFSIILRDMQYAVSKVTKIAKKAET